MLPSLYQRVRAFAVGAGTRYRRVPAASGQCKNQPRRSATARDDGPTRRPWFFRRERQDAIHLRPSVVLGALHDYRRRRLMSAFGTKRTSWLRGWMSAFGGKADIDQHCGIRGTEYRIPSLSAGESDGDPLSCRYVARSLSAASRKRSRSRSPSVADFRMRSASVVLSIVACSFGGRRPQASSRASFRSAIV